MRVLLFDPLGLFIPEQSRTSFETLARTVGVKPDVLLPIYRGKNRVEYNAGAIGSREYQARISTETGVDIDWQTALTADLATLGVKDEAMVSFTRGPNRSGLTMGMLSNIPYDFVGWTRWHNPWIDRLFDLVLFSYRLRLTEPDEEVFAVALAQLSQSTGRKLAPEGVLSVNDSPKSAEAAERLGFLGHCFENLGASSVKIESI